MDHLEKELLCPICDDFFTNPVLLPCQHNICHGCIRQRIFCGSPSNMSINGSTHSIDSISKSPPSTSPTSPSLPVDLSNPSTPRSNASDSKASTSKASSARKSLKRSKTISGRPTSAVESADVGRFRRDSLGGALSPRRPVLSRTQSQKVTSFFCPPCQSDVELGEKGLRGLYRNFALEVIVDRFKLEVKKAMRVPCGACKRTPAMDATKSCLDCKASFCNECFKRVHPWGTGRAQHEYIGPTHNYRPKTLMCTEHPDEKVTMYCEGCKKPICHLCKFTGNHKQHKISVIERKYSVQKEKLEHILGTIQDRQKALLERKKELQALFENTQRAGNSAKDELTSTAEKVLAILEERKTALGHGVDAEVDKTLASLESEISRIQGCLSTCGVADLAREMLKETDKACFIQAVRPLFGRLTEVAKDLKEAETINSSQVKVPSFSLLVDEALRNSDSIKYLEAPTAPSFISADCRSYDDTYLKWTHPSTKGGAVTVDTYTLEYRKHSTVKKAQPTTLRIGVDDVIAESKDWLAITDVKETFHVISGLDVASCYQFRVRATNARGDGPFSDIVTLKTAVAPVPKLQWMTAKGNAKHSFVNISQDGDSVSVRRNFRGFEFDPSSPMVEHPVHVVNEKKLLSSNHYWEIKLSDWPSVIHLGVLSEESAQKLRSRDNRNENGDQDSGHDSADDSDQRECGPDYLSSITLARGMLCRHGNKKRGKLANRRISTVGVFLKSKEQRIIYTDASDCSVLVEQQCVVTEGAVPAVTLWGEGSIHVNTIKQDLLSNSAVTVFNNNNVPYLNTNG